MQRIFLILLALTVVTVSGCAMSEATRKQASYHFQMGLSYLGENNIPRALVEFTEAEKINPEDPELLNYLGLTYFYKKKYELAEVKYLKALKMRPAYSEVRNHLGVNYLEMRRWDDAIKQFQMVSDDLFYQNPEVPVINMGLAYYGKGDYTKALTVLQAAVNDFPRVPQARVTLGKVFMATGKIGQAIGEFRTAIEMNKEYADAHYNLGLAYVKINNNVAAMSAFREVVRVSPDSDRGQSARDYLETLK